MEEYGLFPIWSGWLSQAFSASHNGIDIGWFIKDGANLPCRAYKSGVVVQSSEDDGAGATYVVIKHDNGSICQFSAYWHLAKGSEIAKGTQVKQGDFIGTRGSTGISSGVHLHFMLTKPLPSGTPYSWNTLMNNVTNPVPYLYSIDGDHIECDGVAKMPSIVKPIPVNRDTTKHQVQVIAEQLRVRDSGGAYYCTCPVGIYNVISQASKTIGSTVYVCDEIETGKWIATQDDWTKDLPIEDKDAIIKKLTAELAEVTKKYDDTTSELIKTQTLLTSANEKINSAIKALGE